MIIAWKLKLEKRNKKQESINLRESLEWWWNDKERKMLEIKYISIKYN